MTLTHHLLLFCTKLTLGIAAAMALTSARKVTSGFFRVHLWVILGLQVLAALSAYSIVASDRSAMPLVWLCSATAVVAYVGSVIWLYERATAGRMFLVLTVALTATCGIMVQLNSKDVSPLGKVLLSVDFVSSGLLLGTVTTAMLLGHWYLNTPTMELEPLRRLLGFLVAAIMLRAAIGLIGASILISQRSLSYSDITFVSLRWLSGIFAPALMAKMTWETLKIPNTQSATGILYAGVILVFVGELVAQLLGSQWRLPV